MATGCSSAAFPSDGHHDEISPGALSFPLRDASSVDCGLIEGLNSGHCHYTSLQKSD